MSITALRLVTGETRTLRYQLIDQETKQPIDISGRTFKFAAKERIQDTAYKIAPISGVIDDVTNGKFYFVVLMPATPFSGVFELAMYDVSLNKTVLTPAGGVSIIVRESIID